MAITKTIFFAENTVPEVREQYGAVNLFTADTVRRFNLGQQVWAYNSSFNAWGRFRYVKSRKKMSQKGAPVHYSANGTVGTVGSVYGANCRAGCTIAKLSASGFGWVQVEGRNFQTIPTDKSVAAGDQCIKDQVTAGMLDTVANSIASTQHGWIIGHALADDSGSFMAGGKFVIMVE